MNAVRLRQARLLVRPLWRSRAWSPVPAGALVVLVVAVALRALGYATRGGATVFVAALLMGGAAAFAADDASAAVVASAPAPLAFRAGLRLGGVAVLAGTCWVLLLAYVSAAAPGTALARPTLVLATLVAVGLLAGQAWGGTAGGPAVVAFVLLVAEIPDRWSVLAPGGAASARLALLLALAVAALLLRLRDPSAGRGAVRRSGRSRRG
jgi:hypothetical protein